MDTVKLTPELKDLHLVKVDSLGGYLTRVWKKHVNSIPELKLEVIKVENKDHLFPYFKVQILTNHSQAAIHLIKRDIEIAILHCEMKPLITDGNEVNFIL
jgi:hypothetical protein